MTTDDRTYGESALLTPANMMTAFRIVIAPVFVYLIVVDRISWWTSIVGMSAAASDYFDGIVARRQRMLEFTRRTRRTAREVHGLGAQ